MREKKLTNPAEMKWLLFELRKISTKQNTFLAVHLLNSHRFHYVKSTDFIDRYCKSGFRGLTFLLQNNVGGGGG